MQFDGNRSGGGCGGGGVFVRQGSDNTFKMYGGTISGNYSDGYGGGVNLYGSGSNAKAYFYGGTITGNTASMGGGGIYVPDAQSMYLYGPLICTENTVGSQANNVELSNLSGNTSINGGSGARRRRRRNRLRTGCRKPYRQAFQTGKDTALLPVSIRRRHTNC